MSATKHVFIDGSNVIHAWPELRALEKRDRDAARARLCERVRVLHDLDGAKVTVVFDGRGLETVIEHPSQHDTFTVIYTPSHLTADDVVEHLVGQSSSPRDCYVATDDRAERSTIDAIGGTSISTAELAEWLAQAEQRQRAKLTGLGRQNEQEWRRQDDGGKRRGFSGR